MGTILLKNGIVYDGLGNPGKAGDVLIKDDKIEKVGSPEGTGADQVIDVEGKVICPGFVDIHRHCPSMIRLSGKGSWHRGSPRRWWGTAASA